MPHFHISGIHGVLVFLFIVVTFGALKLLALSYPDSAPAQAWLTLF